MVKKVLIGAAVVGAVVIVVREIPTVKREIKIWRM